MFGRKKKKEPRSAARPPVLSNRSVVAGALVWAAQRDDHYSALEKRLIDRTLTNVFGLDAAGAASLREAVENDAGAREAARLVIAERGFSPESKRAIMEALWRAVYSDREQDYWESKLVRAISKSLRVSGRQNAQLRGRARRDAGRQ